IPPDCPPTIVATRRRAELSQSVERLYATGSGVSSRLLHFRARDRCVENGILLRRGRAELHIRIVDGHVGFEALALNDDAVGRGEAGVGQPQAAVLRQLHELLQRGAAERMLADEVRALVAAKRSREQVSRTGRSG